MIQSVYESYDSPKNDLNSTRAQITYQMRVAMDRMRTELEQSLQKSVRSCIASHIQQARGQIQPSAISNLQSPRSASYHHLVSSPIQPPPLLPQLPPPQPDLSPPTILSTQPQFLYHQHTYPDTLYYSESAIEPNQYCSYNPYYPKQPDSYYSPMFHHQHTYPSYYSEHPIEAQTTPYHMHQAPPPPSFQSPPIIAFDHIQADCGQNWEARSVFDEMAEKVVEPLWYQAPPTTPPTEEEIGLPHMHFEEDDEIEILWFEPPSPTTAMELARVQGREVKAMESNQFKEDSQRGSREEFKENITDSHAPAASTVSSQVVFEFRSSPQPPIPSESPLQFPPSNQHSRIATRQSKPIDNFIEITTIIQAHKLFDKIPNPAICQQNMFIQVYSSHDTYHHCFSMILPLPRPPSQPPDTSQIHEISTICTLYNVESNPTIELNSSDAQYSSVCSHLGFENRPRRIQTPVRYSSKTEERRRYYSATLCFSAPKGSLNERKAVHGQLIKNGIDPDLHLWNSLVNDGYVSDGLSLLCNMRKDSIRPNEFTLATAMKACSMCVDIEFGRQLHVKVIRLGISIDIYIGSALVDLYAKCGEMEFVETVFLCIPEKNDVSWNALLNGYAKMDDGREVLRLFCSMSEGEMKFSKFTLANVHKGCANSGYLRESQVVHTLAIRIGYELDEFWGCCLLDMYSNFGLADDALKVFKRIKDPNVVAWSAIFKCMDQNGDSEEAAKLFCLMRHRGVEPNKFTVASLVRAATSLCDQPYGESINALAYKCGFASDKFVSSALIAMYTKAGLIQNGWRVFDTMMVQDSASWNALLTGFQDNNTCDQGPRIFQQMLVEGLKPDVHYTKTAISSHLVL